PRINAIVPNCLIHNQYRSWQSPKSLYDIPIILALYNMKTASTPCNHDFEMKKSTSTLMLWRCHLCYSGPHYAIWQCKYCDLVICEPCKNKGK
ncbi:uncharacterized protein H6S33_004984, partial [Morchella sextelata]|uniref:uncharacterized protein n=1 Tax=Morchella sextelata TaxID=1174677 RepID=UPI001D046699